MPYPLDVSPRRQSETRRCAAHATTAAQIRRRVQWNGGGAALKLGGARNTLASQGKLFCHRTWRATGWTTISSQLYRETDQDPSDTLLCGESSGGFKLVYTNAGPPVVATGPNGLPVMQLPATENMAMTVSFRPMIGTQASPLLNGRFGWRFYRWNSANDRCAQHKWVQLKIYWSSSGGFPDASTVTWGGNLFGVQGMTLRMFENEWWRWEVYYNGAYWTGVSSATIILTRLSTGVSYSCLLYTSPSPRDLSTSRMPSSA